VIDAAAPIDFQQRQASKGTPQITRAINRGVTTSVTITTAKSTARIRPTWSQ
jgi:hypothetical protein